MYKPMMMAAAAILAVAAFDAAHAQTTRSDTTTGTTTAPASRSDTTSSVPPVSGANSFTEAEARNRIEKTGYSGVSGLKKDSQGVWHGTAMKDGKSVEVALDFKGNVVPMEQNAQVPATPRVAPAPAPTR